MTEKTLAILKAAGWKPNRKIDIKKTVNFLQLKGFDVFPAAKKILEEFGELLYSAMVQKSIDTFHFIPFIALGENYYTKDDFNDYETILQEKIVVIGEAWNNEYSILYPKVERFTLIATDQNY